MSDPIGIAALAKVNLLAETVAGMSAGSSYPTVSNFAGLPSASGNNGVIYVVQSATGVWLINRKEAGLYRSNGTAWVFLGSDVSTTSVQVGATTVTADPLILEAGENITLTPDQVNNKVTISSSVPTSGIAFCLYGTLADNAESTRYVMKSAKTATEVTVVSSTAPSAAITIQLYKGVTQLASFSHSTTSTTNDMADVSLVAGDVLYAQISGAANGVTNITIEVTIT